MFDLLEGGIETGCTGCAYQMPENAHHNRIIHYCFLNGLLLVQASCQLVELKKYAI
ncbi:hypothetical protein ACFSKS_20915 [Pseudocitrobacter faecalis]